MKMTWWDGGIYDVRRARITPLTFRRRPWWKLVRWGVAFAYILAICFARMLSVIFQENVAGSIGLYLLCLLVVLLAYGDRS